MGRRLRGRATRTERGAAAVEFALIMPVLFTLMFGIISTGLVFSDHLGITNAVREGARYGASADATSAATWATSVQTRVKDVYFNASGQSPTDAQICVDLVTSTGSVIVADSDAACGTVPPLPGGMVAGSCAVRVWMSKPGTIKLLVAPDLKPSLHAESVAYYGRVVGTTCTAR